jgi:hypothetical protein
MKTRLVQVVLVILLIVGLVKDFQKGDKRQELQKEYLRLADKTGDFEIDDPDKVYIIALKTDDPLHFLWRIHTPKNYSYQYSTIGGGGGGWNVNSVDKIVQTRLRKSDTGNLELYTNFLNGSGRMRFAEPPQTDWFLSHVNQFKVEQLGVGHAVVVDPTERFTLLKVAIPDELAKDPILQNEFDSSSGGLTLLFELAAGPPTLPGIPAPQSQAK